MSQAAERQSSDTLSYLVDVYSQVTELSPSHRQTEVLLIADELWQMKPAALLINGRLTNRQKKDFMEVVRRRMVGEPLAYILGCQGFYDAVYRVTEAVLIPRPDSECMIDWVLDNFGTEKPLRLLDLGTGCGILALSLAAKRPHWLITATDINPQAIRLARYNASLHHVKIHTRCVDMFPSTNSRYDIIITNPPYLTHYERISRPQLGYEPLSALVGGSDGLTIIRQILKQAPHYLKKGGWLVLEHGWHQHHPVKRLARQYGYVRHQCLYDLAGRRRAIAVQHKQTL